MKILLRDEILADDVDLAALAKRTDLFSGSDLKREHVLEIFSFHSSDTQVVAVQISAFLPHWMP